MITAQILFWKTIEGSRRLTAKIRVWVRFTLFYSELAPHWTVMYVTCSLYLDENNIRRQCQMSNVTWKLCLRQQILQTRLLHENKIVQYLQKYRSQDVNQGYFKKPLQGSTNAMKNNYPNTAHTFFTGHSIFRFLQKQLNYSLF